MIAYAHRSLDIATKDELAAAQREYEALTTSEERQRCWKNARRRQFMISSVEPVLRAMVAPRNRCMYCEDNEVHQIEHFWPRVKYPELTFEWLNFLYACGLCNGPKGAQFATISQKNQVVVIAETTSSERCFPPAFINPRFDDPMKYFKLDIPGNTFVLQIMPGLVDAELERAQWTRDHLPINRDGLPEQRRLEFGTYLADIKSYLRYRRAGDSSKAAAYCGRILAHRHITVFREMQRQWRDVDELRPLFEEAPVMQSPGFPQSVL